MTTSSGAKRRRRRERRFLALCDTLSMRATIVAIVATCGFLLLQVGRSLLTPGPEARDGAPTASYSTPSSRAALNLTRGAPDNSQSRP
jgi:hypothetical protein